MLTVRQIILLLQVSDSKRPGYVLFPSYKEDVEELKRRNLIVVKEDSQAPLPMALTLKGEAVVYAIKQSTTK